MNVFLTSLMHPETANNFADVIRHFELTARTVCSQTNQDFKFIVVCNEVPEISYSHPAIVFHVVNFKPASKGPCILEKRMDKATKLISGLLYVKVYSPKYVYICDADDWLHRDINAYMVAHPNEIGFYVNKGYSGTLTDKRYKMHFGMNRFSGSTFAIDYDLLTQHIVNLAKLTTQSSKEEIMRCIGKDILLDVFNSHRYDIFFIKKAFNLPFKRFPFSAILWLRNTNNNNLGNESRRLSLPIQSKLLHQFSLLDHVALSNANTSCWMQLKFIFAATLSFFGYLKYSTKIKLLRFSNRLNSTSHN